MAPTWWRVVTLQGPDWANKAMAVYNVVGVLSLLCIAAPSAAVPPGLPGIGLMGLILWVASVGTLATDVDALGGFHSVAAKRRFRRERARARRDSIERAEVAREWKWNGMTRELERRGREHRARMRNWAVPD